MRVGLRLSWIGARRGPGRETRPPSSNCGDRQRADAPPHRVATCRSRECEKNGKGHQARGSRTSITQPAREQAVRSQSTCAVTLLAALALPRARTQELGRHPRHPRRRPARHRTWPHHRPRRVVAAYDEATDDEHRRWRPHPRRPRCITQPASSRRGSCIGYTMMSWTRILVRSIRETERRDVCKKAPYLSYTAFSRRKDEGQVQ